MLEKPFQDLHAALAKLRGALREVQVAAAHDETLTAELGELLAALDATVLVSQRARDAARAPVNADAIRRTLPRCQRQLSLLKERFHTGVSAPGALDAHRAQGRAELAWHITRCEAPLYAAEWVLSVCWGKLGAYAVLNPGGGIPGFPPPGS